MNDCVFCKIVKKEIPVTPLYENEQVLAFADLHPMAPIHLLVIPKAHYSTLNDVPDGELKVIEEMYRAARQLAGQKGIQERGYRLAMNVNPEGGQSVFHVHLHLLGGRPMGPSLIG
jgi:histidine triad (HIT) family protein